MAKSEQRAIFKSAIFTMTVGIILILITLAVSSASANTGVPISSALNKAYVPANPVNNTTGATYRNGNLEISSSDITVVENNGPDQPNNASNAISAGQTPVPNQPAGGATATLTPCAGGTTFLNRSITASDTPLPNRISQNGVASTCGVLKTFTGSIATTGRHYDQYTLINNSVTSQCVTVTLTGGSCGTNMAAMSAAYFGSFDPNNLSLNYRADLGSSVNAGTPQGVYSFDVPAFQQFVIIVYDIGTVSGCTNYTLRVDGCLSGPGPSPTSIGSPTRTVTVTRTATQTPTATPTTFPCAIRSTVSGDLAATDPSFPARMVASNASTCAVPVAFPGLSAFAGPFFYDTYTYTNTSGSTQCIEATLTSPTCRARVSAYLGSFDPNNIATNYLATGGGDTGSGPVHIQGSVPAGGTIVYVINEFNSSGATCAAYTMEVRSCGTLASPTPTRTSTPPVSTATQTRTSTPPPTGTSTRTSTPPANTATRTNTPLPTNTATRTNTPPPTNTATRTSTPLPTQTTGGPSATPIPTNTNTRTPTRTSTATNTVPPTNTLPPSPTATTGSGATPTSTSCTLQFADVLPDNTFYPFVRCLACRGIINGYPCGGPGEPCNGTYDPYFRPSNNLTRGQLAKIVSNSAGLSGTPGGQSFEDVPPSNAFYLFIERLYGIGAVGGYPCGGPGEPCGVGNLPYYRPGANVTRGQLTKIVSNAAGFTDPAPATYTFTDVPVGSTFHVFVERLLINRPGAMGGYPCGGPGEPCDGQNRPYFRPGNNLTRGQTSKIVGNTFFPGCVTP